MFGFHPDPIQIYGSADRIRKKHWRIRDTKYNKKAMLPIPTFWYGPYSYLWLTDSDPDPDPTPDPAIFVSDLQDAN